jgi:hypothetical protein
MDLAALDPSCDARCNCCDAHHSAPSTERGTRQVANNPETYLEDTMREWLVIAVGTVIGVTIGIVIGETFEVSRLVGKIIGIACAFFSACLAMGIATMAGWIKPLSDNA